MKKRIKVDLGFGQEEYIIVAENATKEEINKICKKDFGAPLFKVVHSAPLEHRKYNEY